MVDIDSFQFMREKQMNKLIPKIGAAINPASYLMRLKIEQGTETACYIVASFVKIM